MLQIGKMQEVANEMAKYKIDLMALQEIRWANEGKIEKPQYTLFYSGSAPGRRTGLYGTGFMINKKIKSTVMAFEPVNDRISMIRLKGKFCNITIVTAYAPIEDADAEDKDIFYESLSNVCEKVDRYDTLILMGDFNAKVGREQHVVNIAGKYSLHEVCNNNGQRICQFADEISMKIKSTAFERKNIYKGTWKVPGSGIVNQIEHVLVTTRRASSIIDVRSCRGANCDSDHYLVRVTVRQRISNITKQRGKKKIKWNTEKLLQPTVKENYQEKIQHHLFHNVNSQNETIENMTENIEKAIISAATEIVGKAPTQRNSEWFDNECKDAIEIKNEARKKMSKQRRM
ncbi:craniofacial development protein 2-like [Condylostylus longicornis]|uniref:craniofacial development protein 2-like n=1 Tax=Condylostylus longicornis TaxID=2530218 RepID=UPI00244E1BE7|nr:craniofacial development protein 2-like [Condylostylus longicornis]